LTTTPVAAPSRERRRTSVLARATSAVAGLRAWGAQHRKLTTVVGTLVAILVLVALLNGRRHDFATALSRASIGTLAIAAALQIVALLARSEAWHLTIGAAGGTVDRRRLYRASSMGYVGSLLNSQLGMAARIAALRRSCAVESPGVSTLIAAEFPILAVEAGLAALTSFTLVGPLGLPWWVPLFAVAGVGLLTAGLGRLSGRTARPLWRGLAVLRSLRGGRSLLAFVLVAVFAQILRNWLLLNAVGVPASLFDAIAVLIAMVVLGQLPIGPSVGAGAVVLILGHDGVAAAAAAGVLATATGTVGGLAFAAWAAGDRVWHGRVLRRRGAGGETAVTRAPG
jgi:uncharacterized membrane protein YbhN (UPF0104 family)